MIACADDFGLRNDIDRAILELAAAGKLSAVSCMAALERCAPGALTTLRGLESKVDLGLHLCLTDEGLPWSASSELESHLPLPSFRDLLARSLRGKVEVASMKSLIAAQYQLFVEKSGRTPDFLDGHLHVHQFPGVRDALLKFVQTLPVGSRPYIRNTRLPLRTLWRHGLPWLKSGLLGCFGNTLCRKLQAAEVPTNRGFAGIYDFRRWAAYRANLPRFVACLPEPNGILVVHPGGEENWRRAEFEALRGFAFPPGSPNRFRR